LERITEATSYPNAFVKEFVNLATEFDPVFSVPMPLSLPCGGLCPMDGVRPGVMSRDVEMRQMELFADSGVIGRPPVVLPSYHPVMLASILDRRLMQ
jgi:hypothetical protein